MKIYRQEEFIIYDFEDGKTCKYNIEKRQYIGKRNKPVKSLNRQLSGCYVFNSISCCIDDDCKKILQYLKKTFFRNWNVAEALDRAFHYSYIDPKMLIECGVEEINNWV